MEQHALALFHSYRLAVSQHAPVNSEIAITYFIPVGHAFCKRRFHLRLASRFKFFDLRRWSQEILSHVTALAERRFEFFEDEKDFAVVATRFLLGLDVNRPDLTAVLSCVEIGTSPVVGMIETKT